MNHFQEKVSFIWSIAELLRGPYKKEQYGDVILPMSVLRRFDCVLEGETYRYMLTNPPFGVEWKKAQKVIVEEHENKGFEGRFGAGLPRISDGSLLFLQHLISQDAPRRSRIAIVFNGSPLFTGDAGSGKSEIRKWIIENDLLEAIIALPEQLFYIIGQSQFV